MPWTLHQGDCLDVMRAMPDNSFDAVVTDPPYGIGFMYGSEKDVARSADEYREWLRPRYLEMQRVLRPGGFMALWQAQLYFPHFWDWFGPGIHIYCAAKNFVQLRQTPINYGYDPVVMLYKPGAAPLRPRTPPRNIDFYVANTASIVADKTRIEKAHPCPRPLDQVREIVRNFAIPNGTILDPFAGSGTTLLAAVREGFDAVGIEKDAHYCDIIRQRMGAELPLFGSQEADA